DRMPRRLPNMLCAVPFQRRAPSASRVRLGVQLPPDQIRAVSSPPDCMPELPRNRRGIPFLSWPADSLEATIC
ncbi:MAG: hypothetical protein ACREHV_17590, partial [Rhizomicrobium sp.]